jgi:uncharacterized membrane protein/DUF4097 and DUF4098 domain-containing protein YvlB
MNRKDFLRMLENELNILDRVERNEILDFYEERFHTGINYEGKTEEEIIAELEHPKAIARNVLDEYGVAPRFVKKKEERYDNVNSFQALLIICFDIFVATWLIPSLLSITVALFASCITWLSTLPLIVGAHTMVDQYMFALLTGAYILLFFASVMVLDMLIWTSKRIIIWHLNVFKVKKRDRFIKRASSFSIDKFLKNHRGLRFLKNIALIGSIVTIAVSGLWVVNHYELVKDNFSNEVISETHNYDFSSEIEAEEEWNVNVNVDLYDVEVKYVDTDIMEMTHVFFDKDDFIYNIDKENNEIYIYDISGDSIWFEARMNIVDLFDLIFNQKQNITLYVPENLKLDSFSVESAVGEIKVRNINAKTINIGNTVGLVVVQDVVYSTTGVIESNTGSIQVNTVTGTTLEVSTSTGRIEIEDVIANDLNVDVSTGRIEIINSTGTGLQSKLTASSSTGRISIEDVDYQMYLISANTGNVTLSEFNTKNKDGISISASSDTGNVTLTNVFVATVDLETDTGNIYYKNPLDPSFICTKLTYDTDTGDSTISVGSVH